MLAPALLGRLTDALPHLRTRVVLASKEYESWFLAAAQSLAGKSGLRPDLLRPPEPEAVRGAKEWLTRNMEGTQIYSPARHQPALTARFDLASARNANSFDKLCRDVRSLIAEIISR